MWAMVSIVTKFIVIYNDIVDIGGSYTDLRCESFPQCIYNEEIFTRVELKKMISISLVLHKAK